MIDVQGQVLLLLERVVAAVPQTEKGQSRRRDGDWLIIVLISLMLTHGLQLQLVERGGKARVRIVVEMRGRSMGLLVGNMSALMLIKVRDV